MHFTVVKIVAHPCGLTHWCEQGVKPPADRTQFYERVITSIVDSKYARGITIYLARVAMASKDAYGGCFDLFSDDDSDWDANPNYEDWGSEETWSPPARSRTERRRDRRQRC